MLPQSVAGCKALRPFHTTLHHHGGRVHGARCTRTQAHRHIHGHFKARRLELGSDGRLGSRSGWDVGTSSLADRGMGVCAEAGTRAEAALVSLSLSLCLSWQAGLLGANGSASARRQRRRRRRRRRRRNLGAGPLLHPGPSRARIWLACLFRMRAVRLFEPQAPPRPCWSPACLAAGAGAGLARVVCPFARLPAGLSRRRGRPGAAAEGGVG